MTFTKQVLEKLLVIPYELWEELPKKTAGNWYKATYKGLEVMLYSGDFSNEPYFNVEGIAFHVPYDEDSRTKEYVYALREYMTVVGSKADEKANNKIKAALGI